MVVRDIIKGDFSVTKELFNKDFHHFIVLEK